MSFSWITLLCKDKIRILEQYSQHIDHRSCVLCNSELNIEVYLKPCDISETIVYLERWTCKFLEILCCECKRLIDSSFNNTNLSAVDWKTIKIQQFKGSKRTYSRIVEKLRLEKILTLLFL